MTRRASLVLLAVLLATSCASPANPPSTSKAPSAGAGTSAKVTTPPPAPSGSGAASTLPGTGADTAPVITAPRTITAIAGTVTAPANLVAAGGLNLIGADGATMVAAGAGNLVAAGAGNIVAAGAGNLVAAGAGNYSLAQAATPPGFKPVARARVYLTSGDAVLPIAPVETDDQGRYRFPQVPSGVTYQVVVSIITPAGKTGRLASLVKPETTGAVADVSPFTTMVCASVVGQKKALGDIDPAGFKAAAEEIGKLIAAESGTTVDLGDPAALSGKVATLVATSSVATAALASVKATVETAPRGAEDLAKLIQDLKVSTCAVADVVAAPTPGVPGDLPSAPSAIAVAEDDTVYLGDRERRRIVVLRGGAFDRAIEGFEPLSLAAAGGSLYVGDADSGKVVKVAADGTRTDLAADQAYEPTAIAVAEDGTVYFADATRHAIYAVAAGGTPTVLVGGKPGYADGAGAAARLYRPSGLALVGNALYVADAGNRRIRRIDLGAIASISAFAGSGGTGAVDGTGTAARFGYPAAIAADGAGTLWVADAAAGTIRRITTAGVVETVLNGGCVLDAKGLTYGGGLTFARFALYVIDGDRIVRRPVGPQPTATPATAPSGSPSPSASPSASPAAEASASPSATPTGLPTSSPTSSPAG